MAWKTRANVLRNEELASGYWLMELLAPEIARTAAPGQFVHVRCSSGYAPLLRRPFSVHAVDPGEGTIWILYAVVGRGTVLLTQAARGESLDVIGPLGHGFSWPREGRLVLVGGGIGVAPLLFLAERAAAGGADVSVLIGARNSAGALLDGLFRRRGFCTQVATDDGSFGHRGSVVGILRAQVTRADAIFACGPAAVLEETAQVAALAGVRCQVSLEQRMGCGIGACRGCAWKAAGTGGAYKRVCVDGPVFEAGEVVLHGRT